MHLLQTVTHILLIFATHHIFQVVPSEISNNASSNIDHSSHPQSAQIPLSLSRTRSNSEPENNVGQKELISGFKTNNNNGGEALEYFNSAEDTVTLNSHCTIYHSIAKILCAQLESKSDLPSFHDQPSYFNTIQHGVFLNTSSKTEIKLHDLQILWPNLVSLSITQSGNDVNDNNNLLSEIFSLEDEGQYSNISKFSTSKTNVKLFRKKTTIWPSIKILNLSNNNFDENEADEDRRSEYNVEYNSISISRILQVFPNLEQLELKGNRITTLHNITRQNQLKYIDISDNPLDCSTEEIIWLEGSNITLLNLEDTLCDRPPHANRAKPILQTIHIIKKVQEECRVNCSCEVDYIWEQEKVIRSRTSVNCSSRNFIDFPDPDKLPHHTDILYLNNNHITSMRKFVDDIRYTNLNVMNLHLDNNQISSLNELEQSDWIYNFQILSLRSNNLTEVRVHLLENIIRLNKWVHQIDLSDNNWKCECRTLSTFKVWLLQHYRYVKNIGNVKCGRTGREIRYLRNEDWCEIEEARPLIEVLDILNIFMATLILLIIGKVLYDYWNFSRHGKVPWLVGKIW